MEKTDIFALVNELQEEIEMSPTKGFNKNKSIDYKIVMEIIDDIKKALHDELDFSRRIMKEKDDILSEAEARANDIITSAKSRADQMIQQEAVSKAAYDRATKVIESAKQRAEELRQSASDYAEDVFDELETFYKESIDVVRENKSRIRAMAENKPKSSNSN